MAHSSTLKTVVFWPSTEPLRALLDPSPRFGYGWIVPAPGDAHLAGRETGYAQTQTRTVVVAGVFPPRTSDTEGRHLLKWQGVSRAPSSAPTTDGGAIDLREGSASSTPESGGDASSSQHFDQGDNTRREEEMEEKKGRADPEVFALNHLGGVGEGVEGTGRGEIELVLYERHEPGTLRYWEVEAGPLASSLQSTPSFASALPASSGSGRSTTRAGSSSTRARQEVGCITHTTIAHLNAAPRLAARVEGRKIRAYRPAAAVVLALFGAVLGPVLGVVVWVFGRCGGLVRGVVGVEHGSRRRGIAEAGPGEAKEEEEHGKEGKGWVREGARWVARKSALVKQVRERVGQVEGLLRGMKGLTVEGEGRETETVGYVGLYNRFFNALWLILNDLTLGLAVGSFLRDNATYLAAYVDPVVYTMKDALPNALEWLDSWPAGLKLNSDLSAWYVRVLGVCVYGGGPGALLLQALPEVSTPVVLRAAGYVSSVFGLSFLLALVVDVGVGLGCAGVSLGYAVARVGYVVAKEALGGLGALFRGKRYNALRHRMDAHDYDIDQLLFGTMLFTLVAFLSPTAVAFYVLFAVTRLATLLVQASLEIILAFINSFPLFLLVLKVKDGKRIPASVVLLPLTYAELIHMRLVSASTDLLVGDENELVRMRQEVPITGVLRLKSQPRGMGWVFETYRRMWEQLVGHYNPLRLGVGVVRGVWLGGLEG